MPVCMRRFEPKKKERRGRRITMPDAVAFTVRLPAELARRLDAHTTKHNCNRSAAVRSLIERGLGLPVEFNDPGRKPVDLADPPEKPE